MTEDIKYRIWSISIRVLLFVSVFLFGLFRHLFGWEEAAGSLLESHMVPSLEAAIILIHITTILELIFAVWVITAKLNKYFAFLAIFLATIYSVSFVTSLGNVTFINADLTSVDGYMGYPLVLVALVLSIVVLRKDRENRRWAPKWLVSGLMIALPMGYLTYYIPSFSQFENQGSTYEVKYANWEPYWSIIGEKQPEFDTDREYLIGFFNTSCSHCNQAARLIGAYQRMNSSFNLIGVFFGKSADSEFWEQDDRVLEFLDRNNLEIPYVKMVDYQAISISDNHFPVIIKMINKKPSHIYIGDEVNAWAFDHLFGSN